MLVAAFDGIPEFVDLLKKGEIVASGMQQPYLMGVKSGEALAHRAKGGKPDKEILVPIVVATEQEHRSDPADYQGDRVRQRTAVMPGAAGAQRRPADRTER